MAVEKLYPNEEPNVRSQGLGRSTAWLQWCAILTLSIALGFVAVHVIDFSPRIAVLLIAAILYPFVAMIVGDLRVLLLLTVIVETSLGLDANFGYRDDVANLGALGGLNVSVTTVALVGLYALWFSELLTRRNYRSRPWLRWSVMPVLMLALVALSSVVAQDSSLSVFTIALLLQLVLLFVYIVGTVQTRQEVVTIVVTLLFVLLFESLIMIALYIIKHDLNVAGIRMRIDYDPQGSGSAWRVGGTIGSPNSAAGFISMLLPIALSVLLTRLETRYKLLAMGAFGFGVIALILTFSRGGWIAALLSIAVLCFFAWRRGWLSGKVPLVISFVLVLLAILFPQAILGRLLNDDLGSSLARVPLMELAWRIIVAHPLLGVGTNNFAVAMKDFLTPDFSRDWIYTVHNRYLLIWAEAGIGAIVAFIGFLVVSLYRGWQPWKLHDHLLSPLALGCFAAIIGNMYQMTVEGFNGRPVQQLFFVIAALITVIYCLGREGSRNIEPTPFSSS